jgi:hypothetical protein
LVVNNLINIRYFLPHLFGSCQFLSNSADNLLFLLFRHAESTDYY